MDPKQIIVDAFWFDYVDEMEQSGKLISSVPMALLAFLEWLDKRSANGPIIDIRLIKNQGANKIVNRIICGDQER